MHLHAIKEIVYKWFSCMISEENKQATGLGILIQNYN